MHILIAIIVFTLGSIPVASAQSADELNKQAKTQLQMRNYEAAAPLLRRAAELGHPEAQYNLGVALLEGKGLAANPIEANRWLLRSAEQGRTDAKFKLGYSYVQGRGVQRDMAQAFRWFEAAAKDGDAEAQFIIVGMLIEGQGVAPDIKRALTLAEQLAVRETPENLEISGEITNARLNLAKIYLKGEHGVAADPFLSYVWFLVANESKRDMSIQVQKQTIETVRKLQDQLTAEQQTAARKEAEKRLHRPLRNFSKLLKEDF